MKYIVTVPPTMEQGSYKTIVAGSVYQTIKQEALQDYNSARDHDGLSPLKRMPKGTIYEVQRSFYADFKKQGGRK